MRNHPPEVAQNRCAAAGDGAHELDLALRELPFFFFFNDTAPTEFYPLPLHDALPISAPEASAGASTPCRSGTTPLAAPPRSAASSSPCSTSPTWRPTHPSPPNRVGSPLFAPSAQAFQAIAA